MAIIETLSTQFAFTSGIALDSLGNIYVTDTNQKNIRKISADTNEVTVLLSGLDYPEDIILDDKNNIYFIDRNIIKKISADTQEISTIATVTGATSLDIDINGNIYVGTTSSVVKIDSSTSSITTIASGFNYIYDVALDNFGNLYIADTHANMIKKISLDTLSVSTILSTDLNHPTGIDVDLQGNVYISDNSNGLIKKIIVDTTNSVEILHYKMTSQYIAVDSSNNIYFSGNNASIYKMAPNNLPTSSDVTLTIDSDVIKVFKKSDFSFTDLDSTDTLSKIQITSLPTLGTLKLNGVPVTLNQEITSADLNLSKLTYQTDTNAKGQNYTSFDYKVFDGFSYAGSSSTLTFNITPTNTAPTFLISNGKVTTDFDSGDIGQSITLQSDGKILVAGSSSNINGSNHDFAIARYNSDGSLDATFSGDGKVTTDFGGTFDVGQSITLQSDGKILVVGRSYNGSNDDFAIARYNSDGSIDTTFSSDGLVTTDFGYSDSVQSITVQSDGKILVAGDSDLNFAIARYNSDGSLDTTFSSDGLVTTHFGSYESGYSISVQSDGKILVAGSSGGNFAIARYNSNGSLDTTFSGDGLVTTDFGGRTDIGQSITLQSDGKILVAGRSHNGSNFDFAIARYNSDGSLDTTFSGDGKVTTDFGYSDYGQSITLQSDGKILVAGNSNNDFTLARYNSDGSLDTLFSSDGLVTTDFGSANYDSGYSMTVQLDGKILVTGNSSDGLDSNFAIARYNSDGSLDTSFMSFSSSSTIGETPISFKEKQYSWIENKVVLDWNVQIYDAELSYLGNYSGATLTLCRNGGANSQDVFSSKTSGTLTTLTQGSYFSVDSITIGTVTTNSNGTLKLTFNSNATESLINKAMQQITYENTSDAPPSSVQIDWTFNDGNTSLQGTGGALSIVGSTTVNITAVNDTPIITSTSTGTVLENALTSTVIYKITAIDADGTTPTYSLSGTDVSLLNIDSTTGNVTLKSSANYEAKNSYSFNVIASDGTLTDIKAITVNVSNVNEFTPTITSVSTGTVTENALNTTVIYKATATDADANTTLTYSLSGTDASLLNINSSTGDVTLKTSANYEAKSSYSFNVIASDGSLTATKAVVVNVTDVNEVINTAPTITSIATGSVAENALNTTVIYKATATDTDVNTTLAYSLSGTDASLLNINSTTGNVTLKSSANYEAKKSYNFNVIASDGSLTATKAVVVNVTNVNEFAPTSVNKTITINEDTTKVLTLTDFAFSDADTNSTLSKVKITQLETKGSLKLNGVDVILNQEILATDIKANKLIFTPTSNEFGTSYSNFKFQVSDGTKYSTSSYTTTFNVTNIADVRSSSTSYILSEPDVVLTLTGTTAINGTGNGLNNTITGNSANNILNGKAGNDTLKGGLGNDTLYGELGNDILNGEAGVDIMLGGAGNDIYYVDNIGDKVYETTTVSATTTDSGGEDKVNSSVSYTLSSYVESLTLTGTTAINGTGNIYKNFIYGNSAVNTLSGLGGDDMLDGKIGADIMLGGSGNDTYYVDNKDDKVYETTTTTSTIDAGGYDAVNSSVTYTLSNYVERLVLTETSAINGTGNASNNVIYGNTAVNTLSGLAGDDTLNGAGGADAMLGGAGNDTYYIENIGDMVYETKTTSSISGDATGIDTVNSLISYTLTDYVENLNLTLTKSINGTGNILNNIITGNNAVNTLDGKAGNDTLNGGLGNDTLIGGTGKDTFVFNTDMKYNVDTIKDFNVVDDTIHLENSIFSKLATGTLSTANFVSNGTAAIDSNDYLIYNKTDGKLFYDADGSGINKAVQIALIENRVDLTNADFMVI